jgi:glycine/D-amino acid oxidase-like deaminating enzyme
LGQHSNRKTVIIGGGVIGLSVAYHLGKLGKTNIVLLERNQLTSGTSWHAAGIVGPLRSSQNLTELARYAIELFRALEEETSQATGYRQTGGLWLAQTPARLVELKRIAAMGEMNGLETQILSAAETQARFDPVNVSDLVGSLWVGEDGQVNPMDLCMAYARGARTTKYVCCRRV